MELSVAQNLAREVIDHLEPYCERIEVVGSVRRGKPFPKDVDILLIPKNQGQLLMALRELAPKGMGGAKIERFEYRGAPVDLYFATSKTWATLLLIRTGSKEHNIKLTSRAKARGWKLKANGDGLLNEKGERIAGDTEASIFAALGLPYKEPRERE